MTATATAYAPIVRRGLVPCIGGYAFLWHTPNRMFGSEWHWSRACDVRIAPVVECRVDHDPALLLGSTVDGSFRVWKDHKGLAVALTPPNNELGRTTLDRVESTVILGTGFCGGWYLRGWSGGLRDLVRRDGYTAMRVVEVSLVGDPAFRNVLTLHWQ